MGFAHWLPPLCFWLRLSSVELVVLFYLPLDRDELRPIVSNGPNSAT